MGDKTGGLSSEDGALGYAGTYTEGAGRGERESFALLVG